MSEEKEQIPKITKEGENLIVDGIGIFTPFDGSFYLRVKELYLSESMRSASDENSSEIPYIYGAINGKAVLERNIGFEVIGYEDTLSKIVSIEIHCLDDDDLEKIYEAHQKKLKENPKEKKLFDLSGNEKFYTHASFAFSPSNWEYDIDNDYILSLHLPNKIYGRIQEGIRDASIDSIRVGIELFGLFQFGESSYIDRAKKIYFEPNEKEPSLLSMQDMRSPKSVDGYISALGIGGGTRKLHFENKDMLVENDQVISSTPSGLPEKIDILNNTMKSIKIAVWALIVLIIMILLSA